MLKFGRNYRMKIKIGKVVSVNKTIAPQWEEEIEITYPLTVNFQITRAQYSNMNTAHFELYNLSETTRSKIYKDKYMTDKVIRVEFYAGYGTDMQNLPLCFAGDVFDCFSDKRGNDPNIKTEITCNVALLARKEGYINQTFAKDTKPLTIIQTLCNAASLQLGNSDSEYIAKMEPLIEDTPFVGNIIEVLQKYVAGHAYIDSSMDIDKVWILDKADVLPQKYYLTVDDSSILGTPKRRDVCIMIDMLFEPRLVENQAIELKSRTASYFNGTYKIIGFNHNGTISGAVGGNCQTTALLEIGDKKFNFVTENKGVEQ